MANIMTHLGKRAGLLVLAGDVLKTAAACWFCWQLAPELHLTALLYGGFGAVLGHNWPFWNHGHGGKGVAVTCAWLMLYLPVTGHFPLTFPLIGSSWQISSVWSALPCQLSCQSCKRRAF